MLKTNLRAPLVTFSTFDVLCISTTALLVLFALALASSGQRRLPSNRILLVLVILNGLLMGRAMLLMHGVLRSSDAPWLFIASLSGFFALPSLVYLYVTRLFDSRPLTRRDLRHLVPAVLGVALLGSLYVFRRSALEGSSVWTVPFAATYLISTNVVFACYALATVRALRNGHRTLPTARQARWNWGAGLALLFGLHWLFSSSAGVLALLAEVPRLVLGLEGLSIVTLLVFSGGATVVSLRDHPLLMTPVFASPPLDDDTLHAIAERLQGYMREARPYLDPSLSLDDLAAALDLPSRHVSLALNGVLGQHFFDFVNQYRVKEAQRLLRSPERMHDTILGVLYDAGFNSKSAFNRVFKLHTGQTPSAYRRAGGPIQTATAPCSKELPSPSNAD